MARLGIRAGPGGPEGCTDSRSTTVSITSMPPFRCSPRARSPGRSRAGPFHAADERGRNCLTATSPAEPPRHCFRMRTRRDRAVRPGAGRDRRRQDSAATDDAKGLVRRAMRRLPAPRPLGRRAHGRARWHQRAALAVGAGDPPRPTAARFACAVPLPVRADPPPAVQLRPHASDHRTDGRGMRPLQGFGDHEGSAVNRIAPRIGHLLALGVPAQHKGFCRLCRAGVSVPRPPGEGPALSTIPALEALARPGHRRPADRRPTRLGGPRGAFWRAGCPTRSAAPAWRPWRPTGVGMQQNCPPPVCWPRRRGRRSFSGVAERASARAGGVDQLRVAVPVVPVSGAAGRRAMQSTSTRAPTASAVTPTVVRAGRRSGGK